MTVLSVLLIENQKDTLLAVLMRCSSRNDTLKFGCNIVGIIQDVRIVGSLIMSYNFLWTLCAMVSNYCICRLNRLYIDIGNVLIS